MTRTLGRQKPTAWLGAGTVGHDNASHRLLKTPSESLPFMAIDSYGRDAKPCGIASVWRMHNHSVSTRYRHLERYLSGSTVNADRGGVIRPASLDLPVRECWWALDIVKGGG